MESKLRLLQLKCLEIFDIVDGICRKYDIKYSLCGGSVVGAHLYHGFLPWDDDIDLMMTREHYNRFLQLAEKELPKGYSILNYLNSDLSTAFENYTTIEFEGRFVMIIRDYIEYLQTRYQRTDFHEPKKIQVPSHYAYVNFNLPYKEYIKSRKRL